MGKDKTHIEITKQARHELRVYKAKQGMTYSEAIVHLVENND